MLTIRDDDFDPFAADLFLNEFFINSPGNDPPHEFVELKGTPDLPMGSLYYLAVEGLIGEREGSAEKVVDLGTYQNGAAAADGKGYSLLTPEAQDFAYWVPAGTTQIDDLGSIGTENVASQNDSTTYFLLFSPRTRLTTTEFDYDWDNDGSLDLPSGVEIVDSVGVRVLGVEDQLYGPSTNRVAFAVTDPDVDAISRSRDNVQANRGSAWFGGDLFPAGDDYLLYENGESFFLPVTGAAMTPGEPNTGTNIQSPLVSLTSAVLNANGSVRASFSGPVSQVNIGDGGVASPASNIFGAGISISDTNGMVIPTVDTLPVVSGLGTNTLTLTFSGAGVAGGMLPAGSYNLNFYGNGIIANGRATDVANDGSQIDGFFTQVLNVVAGPSGDFNNDGNLDCMDINALTAEIAAGTNTARFDLTNDGLVNLDDRDQWLVLGGAANLTSGNPYLLGDANLDGQVDGSDFGVWNANKFQTLAAWCSGDFNADGNIDGSDFGIWNTNKFRSSDAALNSVSHPVAWNPVVMSSSAREARKVPSQTVGTESTARGERVMGAVATPIPSRAPQPAFAFRCTAERTLSEDGDRDEVIEEVFAGWNGLV